MATLPDVCAFISQEMNTGFLGQVLVAVRQFEYGSSHSRSPRCEPDGTVEETNLAKHQKQPKSFPPLQRFTQSCIITIGTVPARTRIKRSIPDRIGYLVEFITKCFNGIILRNIIDHFPFLQVEK